MIEALTDLQVATSFGGPSPLSAALVHALLADGSYRKHLDTIRRRLGRARREAAAGLQDLGITPWLMQRGGFYLWCRLPEGRDAAELARRARREDVVLAPGNGFSPARRAPDFMRFNVTQMPPRAWEVLRRSLV